MSDEQLKYEQIARYLDNEMDSAERLAFDAAMKEDPSLAREVALQQALQQSLSNPARRRLLEALAEVSKTEAPQHRPAWRISRRAWLAAAAVLLTLAAGIWWMMQRASAPAAVGPAIPQPASPAPATTPDTTSIPSGPDTSPPAQQRIALADPAAFRPNPALDPLVGDQVRSSGVAIEVEQPRTDANFVHQNDRIDFRLKGRTDKSVAGLTLRVFSNRERDFIAGKSIVQAKISTPGGVIDWTNKWKLSPGRYYVVLSAEGEEEPSLVLRFFIDAPTPSK